MRSIFDKKHSSKEVINELGKFKKFFEKILNKGDEEAVFEEADKKIDSILFTCNEMTVVKSVFSLPESSNYIRMRESISRIGRMIETKSLIVNKQTPAELRSLIIYALKYLDEMSARLKRFAKGDHALIRINGLNFSVGFFEDFKKFQEEFDDDWSNDWKYFEDDLKKLGDNVIVLFYSNHNQFGKRLMKNYSTQLINREILKLIRINADYLRNFRRVRNSQSGEFDFNSFSLKFDFKSFNRLIISRYYLHENAIALSLYAVVSIQDFIHNILKRKSFS